MVEGDVWLVVVCGGVVFGCGGGGGCLCFLFWVVFGGCRFRLSCWVVIVGGGPRFWLSCLVVDWGGSRLLGWVVALVCGGSVWAIVYGCVCGGDCLLCVSLLSAFVVFCYVMIFSCSLRLGISCLCFILLRPLTFSSIFFLFLAFFCFVLSSVPCTCRCFFLLFFFS